MTSGERLWAPAESRVQRTNLHDFMRWLGEREGHQFSDYDALHRWSADEIGPFWDALWDYCGVTGSKGSRVGVDLDKMPGARFFPDGELNYAQNLLTGSGSEDALVFRGEDKANERWSWDELRALVSRLQQAFADAGVGKGDRVAAMMPNMAQTIAAMLAATSLGAIWSSCSPDFGEQGVLDRFGQIEPTVFVACDGYWYNGKAIEVSDKLAAIAAELGCRRTIVVPYLGRAGEVAGAVANGVTLDDFIAAYEPGEVRYEPVAFNHPLYILFSSGTTGIPKCIVHSHGGALLQHLKEHRLQCDIRPGDKVFYFTTCGWMMWNWLASVLASGATAMLYDGSPFFPDGNVLFDYAQAEKFTLFGTSAKFIDAVRKAGLSPKSTHDLSTVRTFTSTGSPLAPENFRFVYTDIAEDVHLASMSGGTDIVSCFVLGIPTKPVYVGEIQGPGLGMAVEVRDDNGRPIRGAKGELVCVRPFPSMPVGFWNDEGDAKYRAAYFERYDNIWWHGDYAEWTATGGMVIHGRSDATLNPGGVRIGTAEIYNQVEKLDEVVEGLCIGQQWDDDVRVVLFVRLADNIELDEALVAKIRKAIREGASPRHVPAIVIAVDDIPRTKSGKITELAVRDVVHGRPVKNTDALANPEALELFANLPELAPPA